MGCDGTNQVNLSNHSGTDKEPSWSRGGKLAFSSDRNAAGGFDIYLLTLDPWGVARVTTNAANDESPALSPDGSKVAFVSYRDGNAEIYSLTISSNTLTRITNNAATDADPAWSPDGSRLAFSSNRDGDWDIYITDSGLANPVNLTDGKADDRDAHNDRWPDLQDNFGDEFVAFASDRDGDWEIFTMYSDGTGQTQSTSDGDIDRRPSWDPLAEYMAVESNRDGNYEVATMYYDAGEYRNVSLDGNSNSAVSSETSPDWEPVDDGLYCGEQPYLLARALGFAG